MRNRNRSTEPPGPGSTRPPGAGGYGRPSRSGPSGRLLGYALVGVLAAAIGAGAVVALHAQNVTTQAQSSAPGRPPRDNAAGRGSGGLNVRAVAAKVEPGVVDIEATSRYSGGAVSEGTGMVIGSDGLVLTNNHVIDQATLITATLATSGRRYPATVVGYDAGQDVALLRLNGAAGLRTVATDNSSLVTLGTPVLAIGNAGGEGGRPSVAAGVIDALDRTISPTDASTGVAETLRGMLQTNADITSGDSGGPLVDAAGRVIGMDTADASISDGSGAVFGYAIPIDSALQIARRIAADKPQPGIQVGVPGFLGVLVPRSDSSVPREQAAQQRQQQARQGVGFSGGIGGQGAGTRCVSESADAPVPAKIAAARRGALVDGVLCGTAAASAGLAGGDVITAVNGHPIGSPDSLTALLARFRPGASVTVSWVNLRGSRESRAVTLDTAPAG